MILRDKKTLLLPNWKQVGESKWGQWRSLECTEEPVEAAKAGFKEYLLGYFQGEKKVCQKFVI